jgi:benzoyl-CoA reductase/2-hydroxyglutaryl-CoA dehydratase subunit BcrC/BadD/HgdB
VPHNEVFLTSPWVPAEWVMAHGLTPRGLFATGSAGASPLAAGVCAFAQGALRSAELHRHSVVVFTTTCDQLRRTFDLAAEAANEYLFLFNVPATWQTAASRALFRAELGRLGRFLETHGGRAPTSADLASVMLRHDKQRQLLRSAAGSCPAQAYAEAVARFHWTGEASFKNSNQAHPASAVAIALVGGPFPGRADRRASALAPQDTGSELEASLPASASTIEMIEHAGGRVALDATEAGERSLFPQLPNRDWSGDPVGALVDAYFDHAADVFQRPNTRLYAWLRERLGVRRIRGIVLRAFVGCDLWRAEAESLREAFGLPVLLLEADESPGCDAREAGRVQAFVEMLR